MTLLLDIDGQIAINSVSLETDYNPTLWDSFSNSVAILDEAETKGVKQIARSAFINVTSDISYSQIIQNAQTEYKKNKLDILKNNVLSVIEQKLASVNNDNIDLEMTLTTILDSLEDTLKNEDQYAEDLRFFKDIVIQLRNIRVDVSDYESFVTEVLGAMKRTDDVIKIVSRKDINPDLNQIKLYLVDAFKKTPLSRLVAEFGIAVQIDPIVPDFVKFKRIAGSNKSLTTAIKNVETDYKKIKDALKPNIDFFNKIKDTREIINIAWNKLVEGEQLLRAVVTDVVEQMDVDTTSLEPIFPFDLRTINKMKTITYGATPSAVFVVETRKTPAEIKTIVSILSKIIGVVRNAVVEEPNKTKTILDILDEEAKRYKPSIWNFTETQLLKMLTIGRAYMFVSNQPNFENWNLPKAQFNSVSLIRTQDDLKKYVKEIKTFQWKESTFPSLPVVLDIWPDNSACGCKTIQSLWSSLTREEAQAKIELENAKQEADEKIKEYRSLLTKNDITVNRLKNITKNEFWAVANILNIGVFGEQNSEGERLQLTSILDRSTVYINKPRIDDTQADKAAISIVQNYLKKRGELLKRIISNSSNIIAPEIKKWSKKRIVEGAIGTLNQIKLTSPDGNKIITREEIDSKGRGAYWSAIEAIYNDRGETEAGELVKGVGSFFFCNDNSLTNVTLDELVTELFERAIAEGELRFALNPVVVNATATIRAAIKNKLTIGHKLTELLWNSGKLTKTWLCEKIAIESASDDIVIDDTCDFDKCGLTFIDYAETNAKTNVFTLKNVREIMRGNYITNILCPIFERKYASKPYVFLLGDKTNNFKAERFAVSSIQYLFLDVPMRNIESITFVNETIVENDDLFLQLTPAQNNETAIKSGPLIKYDDDIEMSDIKMSDTEISIMDSGMSELISDVFQMKDEVSAISATMKEAIRPLPSPPKIEPV
jgi:hypothetical protein